MKKASIFIVLGLLLTATAQADKLTNREFLEFTEGQRHWWYSGAFDALGHAVFIENEEKGKCVWNWLFSDYDKREALLMKSFRQYPDHAPTSIILALLRRDCGVFPKAD